MLNYLDTVISVARASPIRSSKTLLGAFVENEKEIEKLYKGGNPCGGNDWRSLYYNDVSTILLEIVGTTMASTPLAFASVMGALFKYRLDLPTLLHLPSLVQMPVDQVLSRIIYEADRLNPTLGVRMRYCERETKLGNDTIHAGEWVASLIAAANLDPRAFPAPYRFNLDRDIGTYLLFNDGNNSRQCWGRDRVAMVVLQECLMAASRLQGLRGVAGKGGEPSKLAGVTTSLPARFTQVASKQAAP
jgi:cytochrome P450